MFVATVVSAVLGANCYLVGPSKRGPVVVVDPGYGVLPGIERLVARFELEVVGVLVTHGHADHIFGLNEVCDAFDADVYIGAGDHYRLDDPIAGLDRQLRQIVTHFTSVESWKVPDRVVEIRSESGSPAELDISGVTVRAMAAPGHTEGSTIYQFDGVPTMPELLVRAPQVPLEGSGTALTGDVLFAGSVGRTDLPGGDSKTMTETLSRITVELDPMTIILAGHGPHSRLDQEMRLNPFLRRSIA